MTTALSTGVLGIAGAVSIGLLSLQGISTADEAVKREDDAPELVLVSDDDDGDDSNDTDDGGTNTGVSRSTGDNTASNFTRVSWNRDASRSDKTRDWTWDGGSKKRDWSDNRTNDQSRNDSRASRNTGDNTRSNYTAVSRDRDISRADKTRDWTRDGGNKKRDWSANKTNDRSRNDTRR